MWSDLDPFYNAFTFSWYAFHILIISNTIIAVLLQHSSYDIRNQYPKQIDDRLYRKFFIDYSVDVDKDLVEIEIKNMMKKVSIETRQKYNQKYNTCIKKILFSAACITIGNNSNNNHNDNLVVFKSTAQNIHKMIDNHILISTDIEIRKEIAQIILDYIIQDEKRLFGKKYNNKGDNQRRNLNINKKSDIETTVASNMNSNTSSNKAKDTKKPKKEAKQTESSERLLGSTNSLDIDDLNEIDDIDIENDNDSDDDNSEGSDSDRNHFDINIMDDDTNSNYILSKSD